MSANDLKTPDLSSLPLVMVRTNDDEEWVGPCKLIMVEDLSSDLPFLVLKNSGNPGWFLRAKPYTPSTLRPMTHAEVFAAIRAGAVVRYVSVIGTKGCATNKWSTSDDMQCSEICYHYTGTDSDVWEPMTKEEK